MLLDVIRPKDVPRGQAVFCDEKPWHTMAYLGDCKVFLEQKLKKREEHRYKTILIQST